MKIFLDMDGVIVDFAKGICNRYGLSHDRNTCNNLGSFLTNDIWMDLECDNNFWNNLSKFEWSDKLVKACHECADTYILSAPGVINSKSASGKIKWLNRYYPEFGDKFILTYHKHLLAGSFRLLIDDNRSQIDGFNKAGGTTILFPYDFDVSNSDIDSIICEIKSFSKGTDIKRHNLHARHRDYKRLEKLGMKISNPCGEIKLPGRQDEVSYL